MKSIPCTIRREKSNRLLICWGLHTPAEPCHFQVFVPEWEMRNAYKQGKEDFQRQLREFLGVC